MAKRADLAVEKLKAELVPPPPFTLPGPASTPLFAPLISLEAEVANGALKTIWRQRGALGNACARAMAETVSAEVSDECTQLLQAPILLGRAGPLALDGLAPKARKELEREAAMLKERREARLELWRVVATFAVASEAGQDALAALLRTDASLIDHLFEPLTRCGPRVTPGVEAMFLSWLAGTHVSHAAWWAARLAPERAFELLSPLCSADQEARTTVVLAPMNGLQLWDRADLRWLPLLEPLSSLFGFRSLTAVAVATLRARAG
ncbi:MAG: hypothetical protein U0228_38170 [Myxococcaceae bacterium]